MMEINGYTLLETCSEHPEQYDVIKDGVQVGYLRLRGGRFRADYPDCGIETVYEAFPKGDGCFDDDERMTYLTAAIEALHRRHLGGAPGAFEEFWDATDAYRSIPLDEELLKELCLLAFEAGVRSGSAVATGTTE